VDSILKGKKTKTMGTHKFNWDKISPDMRAESLQMREDAITFDVWAKNRPQDYWLQLGERLIELGLFSADAWLLVKGHLETQGLKCTDLHLEHGMSFYDLVRQRSVKDYVGKLKNAGPCKVKKLEFMIENGLGWEDMRNDISIPHEL